MERRTKLIILIVVAVAVMLGLILLALAPRPTSRPQPTPTPGAGIPVVGGSPTGGSLVPAARPSPLTKEPTTQATLEALALTFTERYGSYSSDSGLENLRQLEPVATAEWFAQAEAKLRASLPSSGFYGVTTIALSAQIIALDEPEREAQVVVQAQRSETRTGQGGNQFYQQLTLTMVKHELGWKVRQAEWQ